MVRHKEIMGGGVMAQRKRNGIIMMLFLAVVGAGWALPGGVAAETVVKIGGTGSALGTMRQLAEEFAKKQPGTKVQILPSLGSTAGIKALLGGGLALALASRPLTESERLAGATEVEYARSPFVFVTNNTVSQKDVTTRELEGVYSGQVSSWPDGSRIRLILRPEKDIDTKLDRGISPGLEQAVQAAFDRSGMIIAITDQESTEAVIKTPGALGGATLTEIVSHNWPVQVLSFNGVQPSVETIADRSYPLVKSLYLVTTPNTPAAAQQFADFVRSPEGGKILARSGNLVSETR